jgi:hypothetical protein
VNLTAFTLIEYRTSFPTPRFLSTATVQAALGRIAAGATGVQRHKGSSHDRRSFG